MIDDVPTTTHGCWFKSSYSNPSNNCVEIMLTENVVHVRDTKARNDRLPVLFRRDTWRTFLESMATD
ncbi:DUF397 domain-containing protein [Actinosynnema sp. CS-041913]|uniref:DUF397 domain-containing protein n=1 Tax=Actinosynnema sp. CS-041913 TaxID=3239917 RepID=UPI003D950243